MRVLHVSWEYPPLVYGGLGRHVHGLAEAQAALGHDVVVVTQRPDGAADDEVVNGVRVLRAAYEPLRLTESELLGWVDGLGRALSRTAVRSGWTPDVVHAHDWVVGGAATGSDVGAALAVVAVVAMLPFGIDSFTARVIGG